MTDEKPERTIAMVASCIPEMFGPLTIEKVNAGWMVTLNCERECTFHRCNYIEQGTRVSHYCNILEERLDVPDGPVPDLIFTTRTDKP